MLSHASSQPGIAKDARIKEALARHHRDPSASKPLTLESQAQMAHRSGLGSDVPPSFGLDRCPQLLAAQPRSGLTLAHLLPFQARTASAEALGLTY
jgi:hypothetical protein